jgi:putative tryptophan/tyrosine transport system substrate-binding protein
VTIMGLEMGPKRVELAHQLVPNGTALATLINSKFPLTLAEAHDMQAAAHALDLQLMCCSTTGLSPSPTIFHLLGSTVA